MDVDGLPAVFLLPDGKRVAVHALFTYPAPVPDFGRGIPRRGSKLIMTRLNPHLWAYEDRLRLHGSALPVVLGSSPVPPIGFVQLLYASLSASFVPIPLHHPPCY